ncbi:MAG: hypothetical protein JNM07_08255 [Phycisphaerae bacterium]|nr:hypothetical protein [Phycisphaerae bacterium]
MPESERKGPDMWATIRTILGVSFVAILIWVWAESESLSATAVTPRLEFVSSGDRSGGGALLVRVAGPKLAGGVRARVEGSTQAIDTLQRMLTAPVRLIPGVGGVPATLGAHVIDLREALQEHPELARAGVTFESVDPPSVSISIDQLVIRQVTVRAELPGLELDGEAAVTPPTVAIRMPQSVEGRLAAAVETSAPSGFAWATPDRAELERAGAVGPGTVTARVRLPAVLDGVEGAAVVEPERVSVTFRVKARLGSVVLPSVPVWVSVPPTEGKAWDIEVLDAFLKDVTVTGPNDLLARIASKQLVPVAQVMLGSDELDRRIEAKEAVFTGLPSPLQFSAPTMVVRLKITPRAAGASPRTPPPAPSAA